MSLKVLLSVFLLLLLLAPALVHSSPLALIYSSTCLISGERQVASCFGSYLPPLLPFQASNLVEIAASSNRTDKTIASLCGLDQTGQVWCNRYVPYNFNGISFMRISMADDTNTICGILQTDQSLLCFTDRGTITLPQRFVDVEVSTAGDFCAILVSDIGGSNLYCSVPNIAPKNEIFRQIDHGYFYYCGITSLTTISCFGQLVPPGVPVDDGYVQISCGITFCCAIRDDGSISCFGNNGYNNIPPVGKFVQLKANYYHTCAVEAATLTLSCWGSTSYGESTVPLSTINSVTVAGGYASIVLRSGRAMVWGDTPFSLSSFPPVNQNYRMVTAHWNRLCAFTVIPLSQILCSDGKVIPLAYSDAAMVSSLSLTSTQVCVRYANQSAICDGTPITDKPVYQLSCGDDFCCFIDTSSVLSCVGNMTTPNITATALFMEVKCSHHHCCALKTTKTAICFGSWKGEVTQVDTTTQFDSIGTGNAFSCGLLTNRATSGTVYKCWGAVPLVFAGLTSPSLYWNRIYVSDNGICFTDPTLSSSPCYAYYAVSIGAYPAASTLKTSISGSVVAPQFYYRVGTNLLDCPGGTFSSNVGSLSPICSGLCSPGRYGNYSNSDPNCASSCTPGHYCEKGSGNPTPCPAGTFGSMSGLSTPSCSGTCTIGSFCAIATIVPTPCPPGTYANREGLTNPNCAGLCPEGFVCPLSTITPYPCAQQFFCPLGSASPLPIPPGYYRLDNEWQLRNCSVGNRCVNGISIPCDPGTYQDEYGKSDCKACAPGVFGSDYGLNTSQCSGVCPDASYCPGSTSSPILCDSDLFCPRGSAHPLAIPNGFHVLHNTSSYGVVPCDQKFYCRNGIQILCPLGYTCNIAGMSSPIPCSAGGYQPNNGSSSCLPCPEGQYQNLPGQTRCERCGPGLYAPQQGSSVCTPCTSPSVPSTDGTQCVILNCPSGMTSDLMGGCQLCEIGTYNPGPQVSTCLPCPINYFTLGPGASSCRSCDTVQGIQCWNGRAFIKPGWWGKMNDMSFDTFMCPPKYCSSDVISNTSAVETGAEINNCGQNRDPTSPLCGKCLPGYVEWDHQCVQCDQTNIGLLFVVILLSAVFVIFIILSNTQRGTLGIFFYFCQTALFQIGPYGSWIQWMQFVNFAPQRSVSRCVMPLTPEQTVLVNLLFPLLFIVEWVIIVLLINCWHNRKAKEDEKEKSQQLSYTGSLLNLTIRFYYPLASTVLRYLQCVPVVDKLVVFESPAIECGSSSYNAVLVPVYLVLILYTCGLPILLTIFLYRNRSTIQNRERLRGSQFEHKYGILFRIYSDQAYWFLPVSLLRQVVLVILDVSLTTKYTAFVLFNICTFTLHWVAKPFKFVADNVLESISLFLILVVSVILLSDYNSTSLSTTANVSIILLVVPFAVFVFGFIIVTNVRNVCTNVQTRIAIRRSSAEQQLTTTTTHKPISPISSV